ncbi:MAG: hypothetical protein ABI557_15260 [Aureliella sp.]
MEEKKNKPKHEERLGNIRGVVWLNESKQGKAWPTVTVERGYKDSDGEWHDVRSYRLHDLPVVVEVLNRVMNWIRAQAEAQVQDPVPMHAMDEGTATNVSKVARKKGRSK